VRQFIVENMVLTFVSALFGIVLAFGALRVLLAMAPADVPRLAAVSIDARVLAVALFISVAAGLVFGLVPVSQARRVDLQAALSAEEARGASGGRAGGFLRAALAVAEVALAVVLVVGAGLLIKSFWHLQRIEPGFDASGVLKAQFQLPASRYPADFRVWPDFAEMHRFNQMLMARVAALPGVEVAALAGNHPLDAGFTNSFVIVGREAESQDFPEMSIRRVTPDYFRALRVPLVRGRLLLEDDTTKGPPVILVNEAAARRFFPAQDPIGQEIAFWGTRRTIVGVLGNEKFHGLAEAPPIAVYVPLAQAPSADGAEALIIRTAGDPLSLATAARHAIHDVDPGLAVFGIEPLEHTLAQSVSEQRFLTLLLGVFAGLALLLAAIGVHGVLNYAVVRRTREIGVRIALGAPPTRVMRMVLGYGLRLTAIGLGAGLVLGALFARAMAGLLFGVSPLDVTTFAAVFVVLGIVAVLATWLPARRALQVDPIVALWKE
jgi:predicted permease